MKRKVKKQKINIIFNYSDIPLNEDCINLLSKGLNFAVLPKVVDMTQVLVDLKQFERTIIWKEFWHGKEDQYNPSEEKIFKVKKSNLPKKLCNTKWR